jgi:N utilization substance protein B
MGTRRKARELALQMLFQFEFNRDAPNGRAVFWEQHPAVPSVREFADRLVTGVIDQKKTIDELIEKHAEHWALDRMTAVDRNVLRLAIYELTAEPAVPAKVTINEAIDIARRYGDDRSGAFVNGILDHLIKEEPVLLARKGEV